MSYFQCNYCNLRFKSTFIEAGDKHSQVSLGRSDCPGLFLPDPQHTHFCAKCAAIYLCRVPSCPSDENELGFCESCQSRNNKIQ